MPCFDNCDIFHIRAKHWPLIGQNWTTVVSTTIITSDQQAVSLVYAQEFKYTGGKQYSDRKITLLKRIVPLQTIMK